MAANCKLCQVVMAIQTSTNCIDFQLTMASDSHATINNGTQQKEKYPVGM